MYTMICTFRDRNVDGINRVQLHFKICYFEKLFVFRAMCMLVLMCICGYIYFDIMRCFWVDVKVIGMCIAFLLQSTLIGIIDGDLDQIMVLINMINI